MWKLTTREEYGNLVRKIVSETELTKSQMETLAVIAFKYPIKQSDLIKIRTNKAYDHLMELEKAGFITRQRYGRSKLIKLTDKFFEYFDLPREKLKERFLGFQQLASKIESKENEKERLKEEQKIAGEFDRFQCVFIHRNPLNIRVLICNVRIVVIYHYLEKSCNHLCFLVLVNC